MGMKWVRKVEQRSGGRGPWSWNTRSTLIWERYGRERCFVRCAFRCRDESIEGDGGREGPKMGGQEKDFVLWTKGKEADRARSRLGWCSVFLKMLEIGSS